MSRKYNLPSYRQLSVTCGISTFLMLINPEKNTKYKEFLNEIYISISDLMKQTRIEFKWSVVITYILLKSLGNNILNDYLRLKNPEIVDYYMPIVHYQISNKTFTQDNKITKAILRKSLNTMRTDADLKILFYLFGGGFFPQEQESRDGTGGLYFTSKDFSTNDGNYKKKISLLKAHLENQKGELTPCVALNVGYHWVAVNSLNENILGINNPLHSSPYEMKISPTIPEHYRFYLFNYSQKNSYVLENKVREFLICQTM
ncbi:MAG: hypothetical protein JW891_07660 [Candidatus Lokiarchaeota archaeon]|nr:hypothetical protein [Candidatus Lokiarchaeota archaeon]